MNLERKRKFLIKKVLRINLVKEYRLGLSELGRAQVKQEVIDKVEIEIRVEFEVENEVQLEARWVGGWWGMD